MRVTVVGAGLTCVKVCIKRGHAVANFTAYPVAKRRLDRAADLLRVFDPGAVTYRSLEKKEEVTCG